MNLLKHLRKIFPGRVNLIKRLRKTFPGRNIDHSVLSNIQYVSWNVQRVSQETIHPIFGAIICLNPQGTSWPRRCCACAVAETCGNAPEDTIAWLVSQGDSSLAPPLVCVQHKDAPEFLLVVEYIENNFALASAYSASEEFLLELKALSTIPPPPPWIAFPRKPPFSTWNQGTEGYFLDKVWRPYYQGLTERERAALLEKYPAPISWVGDPAWFSVYEDVLSKQE